MVTTTTRRGLEKETMAVRLNRAMESSVLFISPQKIRFFDSYDSGLMRMCVERGGRSEAGGACIAKPDIPQEEGGCDEVHALSIVLEEVSDEEEADEDDPESVLPVASVGTAAADHPPDEEQGQGIEQQQLKVEAHRGMFGENHDEQQHAAEAACQHEQGIVEPEVLPGENFDERDGDGEGEQYEEAVARAQGETIFRYRVEVRNDHCRLFHQRSFRMPVARDLGTIEILHEQLWEELSLRG